MNDSKKSLPKVGIIGGGGYTAGELIRLLIHHPLVELSFVQSESQAGRPVSDVHDDLLGDTTLTFSQEAAEADVLFLCRGHGKSASWLAEHPQSTDTLVIDLSTDFRLDPDWIYGLPELNRTRLKGCRRVANPGCFATAIQLAVLPLAARRTDAADWHVHAITGSTGAGQQPGATTHFSWRNNNVSAYKIFSHQHLAEIERSVTQVSKATPGDLHFIPVRGNFSRGIYATAYTTTSLSESELQAVYRDFYREAAFVELSQQEPHLKQVVNTNKAVLSVRKVAGKALVICVIDNLLKGASGQAVHNMNLALGLDERAGLGLKASMF